MTPYQGFPFYTVRLTSGQLMEVPVDDMFVMKDLDPFDPFKRGLGQSEALADEIETDEYAAKFQKRFFFNDATPNIIIGMPKSTEEQRKRFLAEWMQRFKGVFQSHGVATVNGDITVNKIGESMKDMDMVNGRTFLRNAALEHYGVPREIMGITESSNRSTSEAAQFIYAQNVLMPILRRREEAINHQLIPWFGDDLVWHFDDIVPRNQEFDKSVGIDGWNAGLLTKDEAREKLGMPPAKVGGDVYKTQFSDVYVHEDDDPAEISVTFVDNAAIAELNNQYRNKPMPTDVLSFPLGENGVYDVDENNGCKMLGDIVISMERAQEQATLYGHPLQREVAFLTVHSMLHLLGYDHENGGLEAMRMREKEEAVLIQLGLPRTVSYTE